MNWKKIAIGIGIVDLVVINAGVGVLIYRSIFNTTPVSPLSLGGEIKEVVNDSCGVLCQKYIDQKLEAIITPAAPAGPSATPVTPKTIVKQPVRQKVRSVAYVTIPGSGSTMNNDWVDLAGTDFYFDPADYPGLVEVYFEAGMRLFNGNGMAYVRLADTAHGIGVQGSDVQTNNQASSVVVSGKVSFWAGKNLIRVQAKSLTADTAIYDSGRLRIVTEN